jgi:hypothetical protein
MVKLVKVPRPEHALATIVHVRIGAEQQRSLIFDLCFDDFSVEA